MILDPNVLIELEASLDLLLIARNKLQKIDDDISLSGDFWYYFAKIRSELNEHEKWVLEELDEETLRVSFEQHLFGPKGERR